MKTMNLRDVQDLIDLDEFWKNPKYKWIWEGGRIHFCPYDGTVFPATGSCNLPTHPYPKPNPYRREHPYIIVLLLVALIASVLNNGALGTLIASVTLLLLSLVVFVFPLWLIIYLKSRRPKDDESTDKWVSTIVSLVAAALAMVAVAVMSDQMPDLSWWMIEFGIGYTLDIYLGHVISRRARRGHNGYKRL